MTQRILRVEIIQQIDGKYVGVIKKMVPLFINVVVVLICKLPVKLLYKNKDLLDGRLILRNKLKCRDEHFVITAFDVKDAKRWVKSQPQSQWSIDVDRSVQHNLQELFGPNSSDADLRDATVYYKPRDHRYDY